MGLKSGKLFLPSEETEKTNKLTPNELLSKLSVFPFIGPIILRIMIPCLIPLIGVSTMAEMVVFAVRGFRACD